MFPVFYAIKTLSEKVYKWTTILFMLRLWTSNDTDRSRVVESSFDVPSPPWYSWSGLP